MKGFLVAGGRAGLARFGALLCGLVPVDDTVRKEGRVPVSRVSVPNVCEHGHTTPCPGLTFDGRIPLPLEWLVHPARTRALLQVEEDCIHIIFDSIDSLLGKNLGGARSWDSSILCTAGPRVFIVFIVRDVVHFEFCESTVYARVCAACRALDRLTHLVALSRVYESRL